MACITLSSWRSPRYAAYRNSQLSTVSTLDSDTAYVDNRTVTSAADLDSPLVAERTAELKQIKYNNRTATFSSCWQCWFVSKPLFSTVIINSFSSDSFATDDIVYLTVRCCFLSNPFEPSLSVLSKGKGAVLHCSIAGVLISPFLSHCLRCMEWVS